MPATWNFNKTTRCNTRTTKPFTSRISWICLHSINGVWLDRKTACPTMRRFRWRPLRRSAALRCTRRCAEPIVAHWLASSTHRRSRPRTMTRPAFVWWGKSTKTKNRERERTTASAYRNDSRAELTATWTSLVTLGGQSVGSPQTMHQLNANEKQIIREGQQGNVRYGLVNGHAQIRQLAILRAT